MNYFTSYLKNVIRLCNLYFLDLAIFVFNMHGSLGNWIVGGLMLGLVYPGLIACVMNG